MTILNKLKAWVVILIFISIVSLLFSNSIYSKQKRYINEDKQQFLYEINNSISKSKAEVDNMILNNEKKYIDYKDIKCFKIYHRNLERSIFGFKKKSRFINSELSNGFQQLWDNYNSIEPINGEDIKEYYEQLFERADGKECILLNDEDVYMFQEILKFYNTIQEEIDNLM
ncbi:hypothetical protein SAMN02745784_02782 [Tissierella praeacuta DSM 18095]|uniref:Uncharacterized protein n=1 Tax=Tissierella praeacuta DSM 18095 TaxID=1123404 RepID=A0A1M4YV68_9FIRM|nr:hypothetical protein [Tissierella praeacuta]SHF09467.1 hypothetical protein SAMN02745784_02782 [Tissierella praeacuta DSM 18095]SUP00757.1 Uncharacterised protein [Tissierella praeacuta]